jgi:hypothetical protein
MLAVLLYVAAVCATLALARANVVRGRPQLRDAMFPMGAYPTRRGFPSGLVIRDLRASPAASRTRPCGASRAGLASR